MLTARCVLVTMRAFSCVVLSRVVYFSALYARFQPFPPQSWTRHSVWPKCGDVIPRSLQLSSWSSPGADGDAWDGVWGGRSVKMTDCRFDRRTACSRCACESVVAVHQTVRTATHNLPTCTGTDALLQNQPTSSKLRQRQKCPCIYPFHKFHWNSKHLKWYWRRIIEPEIYNCIAAFLPFFRCFFILLFYVTTVLWAQCLK